ncbi:MAG: type II toxin-antitoxin system VapC family toxin [Chloroflexota bacterium]|nr:type II toxin-antitoxin system VapC family toxin [Chloroflexota bacterium]
MSATGLFSPALVVDASLAVWAVLPPMQDEGVDALGAFVKWHSEGRRLVAPMIWLGEATSTIRRAVYLKRISEHKGPEAISKIFALDIETIPADESLCKAALGWATRLQQVRAYDAFYLALAERLQTEFWTADKRLANAAQQLGVNRVHWIGES